MNWQQHKATKYALWLMCFTSGLSLSSSQAGGSSSAQLPGQRHLRDEEMFLLYEPLTTVTDDAAIDLDQKAMEAELAKGTPEGNQAALNIYSKGAFSKSYAQLTLKIDDGLPVAIPKDTPVFGQTATGDEVRGLLLDDVERGSKALKFRYHASSVQAQWTNCHVGGNPNPNVEGCLSPIGKIEIDDLGVFDYTYNVLTDSHNDRSLQELSTKAESKMYKCDFGCPYPTYNKFYGYYSVHDYGDEWVQAAFFNVSTSFMSGNAAFGQFQTNLARAEAITKGTIYLNLWMYVIKEMEKAFALCKQQFHCPLAGPMTPDCENEEMLHSWDKAVAFYVGSAAKVDGTGTNGYLLYSMAQKHCLNFGTCTTSGAGKGMAIVNYEVLMAFRQGQQALRGRDCGVLAKEIQFLTSLMTVPIIQGVLRYAYRSDKNVQPLSSDIQEKEQAEGATYAAALLPLLHSCNVTDASILYEEMKVGKEDTPNFAVVKDILERNYASCFEVSCEFVGGLVDAVKPGEWMPGAEPCKSVYDIAPVSTATATKAAGDTGPNVGLAVGLSVFFVALLLGISVVIGRKTRSNDQEFIGAAPYSESMEMT